MRNCIAAAVLVTASLVTWGLAAAQTVECRSQDYQYNECSARDLSQPQLIHQISSAPCIVNRTWGYNPRTGYIWVGNGCAGTFADVGGYHHGRGDTFDEGARHYDQRGQDAGAVVAGLVLGAIISGAVSSDHPHHQSRQRGYDGCHGEGCLVTRPDGPPEPGQNQMR